VKTSAPGSGICREAKSRTRPRPIQVLSYFVSVDSMYQMLSDVKVIDFSVFQDQLPETF
jgi:hypothetical protein